MPSSGHIDRRVSPITGRVSYPQIGVLDPVANGEGMSDETTITGCAFDASAALVTWRTRGLPRKDSNSLFAPMRVERPAAKMIAATDISPAVLHADRADGRAV
jgi:hypothetical protein